MSKWKSRKLWFAVGVAAILGAVTIAVPSLAPMTIKALTTVAGIYLGAQGFQNAVEKFSNNSTPTK